MKIPASRYLKSLATVLGWATSMAAFTLATIFQGQLLPKNINGGGLYAEVLNANPLWQWFFYVGNFLVCMLAAMFISDWGRSFALFFPSFIGAAIITDMVLASPGLVTYDPSGIFQQSASIFTFTAFFPILLLVNLVGAVAGSALGERVL